MYPKLLFIYPKPLYRTFRVFGYNQPTHLGYYLGSDTPGVYPTTTGITEVNMKKDPGKNDKWYNLMGMEVTNPTKGIYVHHGKKVVFK